MALGQFQFTSVPPSPFISDQSRLPLTDCMLRCSTDAVSPYHPCMASPLPFCILPHHAAPFAADFCFTKIVPVSVPSPSPDAPERRPLSPLPRLPTGRLLAGAAQPRLADTHRPALSRSTIATTWRLSTSPP